MSELIILQDGQSGYDVVAEYVLKYWDKTYYSTAIVSLETSYDGRKYDKVNEVVSSLDGDFNEFLHDWWEGQKFIKINGVKNIDEIEIAPTADVVKVRHGYWKDLYENKYANHYYQCSVCGRAALDGMKINGLGKPESMQALSDFCPHCGAKIDGRSEQNEG